MKGNRFMGIAGAAALAAAFVAARGAEATNATTRADYASFRVVVERNIFNASRSGRQQPREREPARRPARTDTFGLVGTMTYEKGPLAFFDGSSSDYRQVVKPGGTIAGFQLEAIRPDAVTLRRDSNTFELFLGTQMRREDGGEWKVAGQFEAASSSSGGGGSSGSGRASSGGPDAGAPATAASGGGDVSEVLRRLMEKRERESQ